MCSKILTHRFPSPHENAHASPEADRVSEPCSTPIEISTRNALNEVQNLEKAHVWDPSMPSAEVESLHRVIETEDAKLARQIINELVDEVPYVEVKAAVKFEDGGEVANTIRAWVLGVIVSTIITALNMFLSMRSPAIAVPVVVPLLIVYPCGVMWAKNMPKRQFQTFGIPRTLNTGPFTIKEHAVMTLMANVTNGYAYSTDALLALKAKSLYNLNIGWGFQIIFTLSSQLLGLAISLLFRRYIVWPAPLLWPGNFSTTSLLYTLHNKSRSNPLQANGWQISRYRWFVILTSASFVYYWFPGVIWQGLSVFAFVTWIWPNNATINQLFGGFTGLSLIPLTFDWTYVSAYLGNPLLAPTYAHTNTLVGLGIFVIIPAIGIGYTNAFYSDYLPESTTTTFDNAGNRYNVSRILGPNHTFDVSKYELYSPMFLAPTFALNYGLSFAACAAAVVHTFLYHGKELRQRVPDLKSKIWLFSTTINKVPEDFYMRQIAKYAPAPDWWYFVMFLAAFALGLATVLGYPSQLPGWVYLVSIDLNL